MDLLSKLMGTFLSALVFSILANYAVFLRSSRVRITKGIFMCLNQVI